jgi:hypothetical protein
MAVNLIFQELAELKGKREFPTHYDSIKRRLEGVYSTRNGVLMPLEQELAYGVIAMHYKLCVGKARFLFRKAKEFMPEMEEHMDCLMAAYDACNAALNDLGLAHKVIAGNSILESSAGFEMPASEVRDLKENVYFVMQFPYCWKEARAPYFLLQDAIKREDFELAALYKMHLQEIVQSAMPQVMESRCEEAETTGRNRLRRISPQLQKGRFAIELELERLLENSRN